MLLLLGRFRLGLGQLAILSKFVHGRHIVLAFALIHCGGNKQSVLTDDDQRARLYDDGRYAWIQDTGAVLATTGVRAVVRATDPQ